MLKYLSTQFFVKKDSNSFLININSWVLNSQFNLIKSTEVLTNLNFNHIKAYNVFKATSYHFIDYTIIFGKTLLFVSIAIACF